MKLFFFEIRNEGHAIGPNCIKSVYILWATDEEEAKAKSDKVVKSEQKIYPQNRISRSNLREVKMPTDRSPIMLTVAELRV